MTQYTWENKEMPAKLFFTDGFFLTRRPFVNLIVKNIYKCLMF